MIRKIATRIRAFLTAPLLQKLTEFNKLRQHASSTVAEERSFQLIGSTALSIMLCHAPEDIGFRAHSQQTRTAIKLLASPSRNTILEVDWAKTV